MKITPKKSMDDLNFNTTNNRLMAVLMRWHLAALVMIVLVAGNGISPSCQAKSTDTAEQLQYAVLQLSVFIGHDANAERWRRYLNLNSLQTQSALGHGADATELSQILARFRSGAGGLNHPAFADVRIALDRHIRMISHRNKDMGSAIAHARNVFHPVQSRTVESQRKRTLYDLRLFKNYLGQSLPSAERQTVLAEMRFDEIVKLVSEINVDYAPIRTIDLIKSEIDSSEKRIEAIDKQLDSLNGQLGQVKDWLENLQNGKVQKGSDPPMPDDDNDKSAGGTQDDADAESKKRKDEGRLKMGIQSLERAKQDLRDKIEQLKVEQEQAVAPERARLVKIRAERRKFAPFIRVLDDLALHRHDIYFDAARRSFVKFNETYNSATNSRLKAEIDGSLETIQSEVQNLTDAKNRAAQALVGKAIGDLGRARAAAGLVSSIRSQYSLPNLEIAIDGNLLSRMVNRPIDESRPINETIGGKRVEGQANVSGNVSVDLVDNPNQAQMSLHLSGQVLSDTHLKAGPITAFASAYAAIEARRSVYANIFGFHSNSPYGAANLASQFHGTSSRSNLINRIADTVYQKGKYKTEGESARRLEEQFIGQFREQTDTALNEGRTKFVDVQSKIEQYMALLPHSYLRTTPTHLKLVGTKYGPSDLGAPVTPPTYSAVSSDVKIKLHESFFSNYATPFLAGKAFSNQQIADKLEKLGADATALRESEKGDWQILFADKRPIQVEFENNGFAIAITGSQFRQGRNRIRNGLRIRMRFKIERIDGKLFFVRDGVAEVEYMGEKDGITVAFKSALEKQLNSEDPNKPGLKLELTNNLVPTETVPELEDYPNAKRLQLNQFRSESGWLAVGWNLPPEGVEGVPTQVDTPAIWEN